MRANEFLDEAPIPDTWDKDVYKPSTPYKKRIEYAVARAQKLGRGSSRTAFVIDHEGRQTVLKIAHNQKGMAQNEAEANILNDGYAQHLEILIPLIDYDTEHSQPVWIHTEKAERATERQLCKIMGCKELVYVVAAAQNRAQGKDISKIYGADEVTNMETFLSYVDEMQELMSLGVGIEDFTAARNWGIFNGRPVVIDLGFNDDIYNKYYK